MARKKQRVVKHDMGPEPSTMPKTVAELSRAYQWYNYEYTAKQGRKFLESYVKKHKKEYVGLVGKMKDHQIPTVLMWQARMMELGILPKESAEYFDVRLRAMIPDEVPVVKPVTSINRPSVQDRIREQVSSWIADIEDEIDQLGTKVKTDFSVYSFLQTVEAKPVHVNPMLAYYRPIRDEVVEALAGKDAQLNEAYSYLSKAALKRLVDFYETLIGDMERIINNKKVVRKPRKPKVKSAGQLTKSVKYLPESNEFKIVSAPPEKLVGASQVWLFNVKYKSLSVYNALTGGIQVKGTSLQNYDPDNSVSKRVRKPGEALQAVQKSGKVALRKLMDTFNTKASEAKGRINKDTIIVRIL